MNEHPDPICLDLKATIQAHDAFFLGYLAKGGFADITLAEADVLGCIDPDGSAMGQIATRRGVTKQAIQSLIKSLLSRSYVQLKPDPNDARAKRVMRSQRGHQLAVALAQAQFELHAALEAKLGVERLKNMRNMLGQMQAALR